MATTAGLNAAERARVEGGGSSGSMGGGSMSGAPSGGGGMGGGYQGTKTTSSPSLGGQTVSKSMSSQGSGAQKDADTRSVGGAYVRSPSGTMTAVTRGGFGDNLVQGRPGTSYEGLAYAGSDVNDYLGIGNDFWDRVGNFGAGMLGVSELDPRAYGASQPGVGADYGFDAIGTALGLVTGIPGTGALYRGLTGGSTDINLGPDVFGGIGMGGLDGVGSLAGAGLGAPARSSGMPGGGSAGDAEYWREKKEREARDADLDRSVTALLDTPLPPAGTTGPVAPTGPGAPAVPDSWYTIRGMAEGGAVYPEGTDYLSNIGKPRLDRWYSPGSDWKPSLYYNNDLGGLPADYLPNNVVTWGAGERIGPGIHNPTSTPGNPNGTTPPPVVPPVTPPVTPPASTGNPSWWHAPMTYADFMGSNGGGKWAQDLRAKLGSGWTPTQRQVDQWDADTADEAWGSGGGGSGGSRPRMGFQDGGMLEVDGRMLPVESTAASSRFSPAGQQRWPVPAAVPIRGGISPMPMVPPDDKGNRWPLKKGGRDKESGVKGSEGMTAPPGSYSSAEIQAALAPMEAVDISDGGYTGGFWDRPALTGLPSVRAPSHVEAIPRFDDLYGGQTGPYWGVPRRATPMDSWDWNEARVTRPKADPEKVNRAKALLAMYGHSGRVKAPGGGRDDLGVARHDSGAPIALADGEYVLPADYVAARGQGSTDHGARVLDQEVIKMRGAEVKRLKSLPPPKR